MRAQEFITETMNTGKIHSHHIQTLNNVRTYGDQNMYHGSAFDHSRFLLALAAAGAGDTEDGHMPHENFIGGDPMYSPYHPVEEEMLDRAAKHVGDNSKRAWGGRSHEPDDTHKVSPHKPFKGYPR